MPLGPESTSFSDKSWSGTPMWQIASELEAQREARDAEERRKASTPVAVLNLRSLGDTQLCELTLLIPSKALEAKPDANSSGFREVKVRGPKRKTRREAMKDGFELRDAFYASGEAAVRKRQRELGAKDWTPDELPPADAKIEVKEDKEQRLRLAQRPRGTGWSRQKDAEFFKHTHSPMAYDPKKMQYFTVDGATQLYVPCEPPHDPVEYPISVSAGASLVGRSDGDMVLPERPRSLLLKELVKTGVAMRKPLFFLDQPACCFALFEGLRGGAAVDYCSKNFHTKLLARLSSRLEYWSDADAEALLCGIFEELDNEVIVQGATCYDGVSAAAGLLLGDRLVVATLGAVRGMLMMPDGEIKSLGSEHWVCEEGPERQRVDTAAAEVLPAASAGVSEAPGIRSGATTATQLVVRRPVRPRETSFAQEQAAEIQRVLESAPDSFAVLGFGVEDVVDGKAAKASYRKLALKVHPDKAPSDLKDRAKEAFAKVEAASEQIEQLCDMDSEAFSLLQKLLASAGSVTSAVMPRSWAYTVLGVEEGTPQEDAEQRAKELRKTLAKLGQFADGRLAPPDAARAGMLLDEALEVLAAPVPKDASSGPAGSATGAGPPTPMPTCAAVSVTRAIGLRDLKKPRPIITAVPHITVVQLDRVGSYRLALLSSATSVLTHDEIAKRGQCFPRQPKAASLVIAQDASEVLASQGCNAPACLASSVVGVFEVAEEKAHEEPPAKKARTDGPIEKVRCLHILLKHKDLKLQKDAESQFRMKGKPAVTRTLPQAERELLAMQRSLAQNPNNFHVLARKHSECDTALQPGQNAGDLGWVTRGSCPNPQFEAAMFALRVYEVSDIVTTPRGLHIIQRIA